MRPPWALKKISNAYGKPYMQVEFGGPVSKVSSTEATLKAYLTALKNGGGQGAAHHGRRGPDHPDAGNQRQSWADFCWWRRMKGA